MEVKQDTFKPSFLFETTCLGLCSGSFLSRSQPFSFAPPHLPLTISELPYEIKHFLMASSTVMGFYNSNHSVISKAIFPGPMASLHWAAKYKFPQLCLKRLLLCQSDIFIRKSNNGIARALQSCGYLQSPVPPQRQEVAQKAHPGKMKHDGRLKGQQD